MTARGKLVLHYYDIQQSQLPVIVRVEAFYFRRTTLTERVSHVDGMGGSSALDSPRASSKGDICSMSARSTYSVEIKSLMNPTSKSRSGPSVKTSGAPPPAPYPSVMDPLGRSGGSTLYWLVGGNAFSNAVGIMLIYCF